MRWTLACLAVLPSCSSFRAISDEDVSHHKLTVDVDWPTLAALDPRTDIRRNQTLVTVTDTRDASRTVTKDFQAATGPFSVEIDSSNRVDVTITLQGTGRVLAYGAAFGADIVKDSVTVAVRKRILYVVTPDRDNGTITFVDMADAKAPEPGAQGARDQIAALADAEDGWITRDGVWLVHAGNAGKQGAVRVVTTGSHEVVRDVALPFTVRHAAPIGDGKKAVIVRSKNDASSAALAVVDLTTGAVSDTPVFSAGTFDARDVAASADGTAVAAVGEITAANNDTTRLLAVYDATAGAAHAVPVPLDVLQGVSFTPDGKTIVLAGWEGTGPAGSVIFLDRASSTIAKTVALDGVQPAGVVVHPDGHHVFVSVSPIYPAGGGSCCGEMRIVDMATGAVSYKGQYLGSGPDFDVISGVRLPYAPGAVLGGMSDNGNNVNGTIVDITDPAKGPVPLGTTDWGSAASLLTPFGTTL